ncbi:hypothetical protein BLOT_005956 [Blomia tropicalis]|nr:hypothetical protein BLOT_005956 [Blomia tropicalis]
MTSRLDRLFLLLETGSTPLTRKAAALQLGEVQKFHPHELTNLLVKVRQYLHNNSWDTRIAASQAVEAIISNVPLWFPPGISQCTETTIKSELGDANATGNTILSSSNLAEGRMQFDYYDVHRVIKCGHNLLASEGKEFDDTDDTNSMANTIDSKEKIARQRQILNERLGLSMAEKLGFKLELDLISNVDIDSGSVNVNVDSSSANMSITNEAKFNEILTKATGRPLLKPQTIGSNATSKPNFKRIKSTESMTDDSNKKIKIEPNDDTTESLESPTSVDSSIDRNEWPLEWFSDELMGDLFNPLWEVRHGAATGIREIVKLHGRCGGRNKAAYANEMDKLNQQWLEDLSLRLLSVLALDRFGDFLSDQVVAPVRETCAQVLGLVIKLLSVDGVRHVLSILLQLLKCNEWEARHGGMLGMKYLLAIRHDMIDTLLPEVFEPVFNGLKDSVDDVSAVAAAALVPVKNELMSLIPEKVPIVIAFLWEALLDLDDLSSSTGDLLMLLSSLLTFKGLEMQHNLLAYDDKELVTLIPRLWPFLSHSLSSVRKSVLDSLLILCEKSSDDWLTSALLSDALRLLYQRSLIENIDSILEMLYKVWLNLLSKSRYQQLIEATCNYVTGWICLMMHPQKAAIDPSNSSVWLNVKHTIASQLNSTHKGNQHTGNQEFRDTLDSLQSEQYFIGGAESLGDSSEERDRCVIRARYQCARLIGTLAYFLTKPNDAIISMFNGNDNGNIATPDPLESFANILLYHLNTKSAIQRMCTAWIIKEWAIIDTNQNGERPPLWLQTKSNDSNGTLLKTESRLHQTLSQRCFELLQESIYYDELQSQFARIQIYTRDFLTFLQQNKLSYNDSIYSSINIFTFQQINELINEVSNESLMELRQKYNQRQTKKAKGIIDTADERIAFLRRSLLEIQTYSNSLSVGVNSALASALISWHYMPEKMNPIIRPIMDSIKAEEHEQLQRASASSLVQLLRLCCERIYVDSTLPTPLPKIIKNLISYLCSDRNFTPEISLKIIRSSTETVTLVDSSPNKKSNNVSNVSQNVQLGILTLENMQKYAEKSSILRRTNSLSLKNQKTNDETNSQYTNQNSINGQAGSSNSNPTSSTLEAAIIDKQNEILRRGATIALSESCIYFGLNLPDQLPTLWKHIQHLANTKSLPPFDEEGLPNAQHLIQCLQVLEVIGPHLESSLYSTLTDSFEFMCLCLESPYITIRHMVSRCFGMLATIMPNQTMNVILTKALDLLDASDCELKRQGSVEAICNVIERMSLKIVPYIVLLIVPMLGRMSDQNENVRLLATHCFAQLVQLMPLDNDNQQKIQTNMESNGIAVVKNEESDTDEKITFQKTTLNESLSPEVNLSDEFLKRKENERHFLEQLMDIKKIDDYKLPIPVQAELRTYQHDGLNWLAFLNKYKLHGIVADEMGLGKTLQAICILASDQHYMVTRYLNGESNNRPLLSIVICPPTLTGHWMYEVEKFVKLEYLNPIQYTGPPLERANLKKKIKKAFQSLSKESTNKQKNFNLIIASYDLVRNDIDFFSSIHWNYCILDEGHVIKNGKTKLAKAIKSLTANHRLILTGTPIQNNVLELWSLFDFLMPGFLGSERQFMARYSKPILASRDAKSSSKEQEAGILAMEGLHRQVLPFILRRMKEDVLKDLPPKIVQDYYCDLSPLQAQLYEDFYKSRARQSLKHAIDSEVEEIAGTNADNKNTNKSHIFQSLQYLRKVCNHPKLVLTASHPHYNSIMEKMKTENNTLSDINNAAKLCALKQLLLDCGIGTMGNVKDGQSVPVVNQHRALIFCQLKSMLNIVENDLLKVHMRSVTYLRLDGDVPANSRYSVIHRFNNDPSIDILLLTTQVGGLGLNLTGADTVIFVEHDWNPMKDLQAMDRAHRIGQKKVVNVYRLITTGTLEEKIMGLQKFKLTIANTVISSENSSLESMATDQLLDLFELSSSDREKGKSSALSFSSNNSSSMGSSSSKQPVSMKMMLDNLPELWDIQQYENEYDLNNFLQSLQSSQS